MKIYPSLISSDLLDIKQTLATFDALCDGYHLDVMDDHFVPNLTWGPAFINAIRTNSTLPLHIHLMVEKPESWLDRLDLRPNDVFIFHYEAIADSKNIKDLIKKIRVKNIKVGIAIKPQTTIENVVDIVAELDMLLLMSVEPGFSGQAFMPEVLQKLTPLNMLKNRLKKELGKSFSIGIDGGINEHTIIPCAQLGVEQTAIASAIFGKPDPVSALQELYKLTRAGS